MSNYGLLSEKQIKNLKTRQLLARLRQTYHWCEYDYEDINYQAKLAYQAQIKAELATREHIPNKIESKKMRIARKKKGN